MVIENVTNDITIEKCLAEFLFKSIQTRNNPQKVAMNHCFTRDEIQGIENMARAKRQPY